jgi:hypothetical protein
MFVRRREVLPDIAQRCCAKYSIYDCMYNGIGVGMAAETKLKGNDYAPKN